MKSLLLLSLIAFPMFAQAAAPITDKKEQALGEQCSLIVNYHESTDGGGCGGGDANLGDVIATGTAGLEGGKYYTVIFYTIDQNDHAELAFTSETLHSYSDKNVAIDANFGAPFFGKFAVRMDLVNANTNTVICTAQQMVTAN